jgi:hypothetical protein
LQLKVNGGGVGFRQEESSNTHRHIRSRLCGNVIQEAGQQNILEGARDPFTWTSAAPCAQLTMEQKNGGGVLRKSASQHLSGPMEPVFLVKVECIIQKLKLNNNKTPKKKLNI